MEFIKDLRKRCGERPLIGMTNLGVLTQGAMLAMKLLAERGYDGTSVEEVAARAGVSKPVVYEHFGGKEGLYLAVFEEMERRLLAQLMPGIAGVLAERADAAATAVTPSLLSQYDTLRERVGDVRLQEAEAAGAEIAHPPLEIPSHGKFAIFSRGGIHHGLWQL